MAIKHIWFDCDGTLYASPKALEDTITQNIIDELHKRTGRQSEQLLFDFQFAVERIGSKTGAMGQFGIPAEEAIGIINRVNYADFVQFDARLGITLFDLRQQNINLSIFTNNKRPTLNAILAKLQLDDDWFHYLMCPPEVKPKPDDEGYGKIIVRCMNEMNQNPEELLFVGDREKADIEPARKYGMNTLLVWAKDSAKFVDDARRTYHFKKRTIYELTDVIAELNAPEPAPYKDR